MSLEKPQKIYYPFAILKRMCFNRGMALFFLSVVFSVMCIPAHAGQDKVLAKEFRDKAQVCIKGGDYSQALFYYSRAVMFNKRDAALYNEAGMAAEASGANDEAEKYYQASLNVEPGFLPAYYNLGVFYLGLRKYELAEYNLKQRVALGLANDPWTLKAQEKLDSLYEISPKHRGERLKELTAGFEMEILDQKRKDREITAQEKQKDIEVTYRDGLEAMGAQDYWLAVRLFEECLALDPTRGDVQLSLERAKARQRMSRASAELDGSLKENKSAIMDMYLQQAGE